MARGMGIEWFGGGGGDCQSGVGWRGRGGECRQIRAQRNFQGCVGMYVFVVVDGVVGVDCRQGHGSQLRSLVHLPRRYCCRYLHSLQGSGPCGDDFIIKRI